MFQGTTFGAPASSTFGQPTFGKPATTGFNTPVFGSTGGTSLFGGPTTQPSGSLFGSSTSAPAFGQTQTTQPAFGGGFSTTGTSTGLFGTQQNANTGTSLFGSGTTSAFGQAKPSFGGFGTTQPSTGLFGQQAQQPQQQSSLFGQPATQSATGLFGGTAFGTTAQGGTTIKFTPVTGSDTMVKNGVSTTINTRHHCITCMKEYESKSLEELRLEDYAANRKGPQQGAQGSAGLFGSTGQTSMFGGGTNTGTSGVQSNLKTKSDTPAIPTPTSSSNSVTPSFGATGSSVFGTGANAGNTLFGKAPGTGASAFGTPATTATTSFGFNTNTSLFGNNASQVKPFGAPTQGAGLFGSTQQPSTAFGAQPAAGFGAFGTQQTGSLFGANKPAFSLGNTPNTGFAFGQTSTPSTTGASLFAKPATTGFGTTFGTPATTATGFPTPGFGTTNQNSFGTNLKGPNFSFGPTPTSNTLGTGLGTLGTGSSSLFGNTASKPVFGQTTGTTTGLFGTGTFGATSSPFNTTTSTGLGQNSFQLGGTGNSLLQGGGLGATQTTPTSNTINQHMLALASMPFGDSPLFKNILTTSGKANELIKPTSPAAQKALIAGQNFKVSPKSASKIKVKAIGANNMPKCLFDGLESNNSIYDGGSKPMNDSLIGTVRPSPKRLVLRNTSYSNSETVNKDDISNISPVVNNNLPVTSTTHTTTTSSPTSTPSPGLATLRFITPSLPTKPRTSEIENKDSPGTGSDQEKITSPKKCFGAWTPSSALTDCDYPQSLKPEKGVQAPKLVLPEQEAEDNGNKSVKFVDANDTITELRSHSKSFTNSPNPGDNQKDNTEQSTSSSSGDSELEDTVPIEIDGDCADHPTGIVLRRIGYYTIPPLDKLEELMDGEGRCIVDNFTIGRMNYGNIFYPESFDVAGLNIDEIVHFRHKEVVVYPDDDKKPPVGSGLNRKAQVTLDRVWPIDKTTRLPISDPVRIANLDYENKLRLASAKHGTRFVEYRPHTGSWVFKVDHFSKYGLSDSDEEDAPVNDIKKIKVINLQGAALQMKTPTVAPATFPHKVANGLSDMHSPPRLLLAEEDEDMEDGINTPFDLDDELEGGTAFSPTSKLARQLGTSSHKVQLMKASFFEQENYGMGNEYLQYEHVPEMNTYMNEYGSSHSYEISKVGAVPFYGSNSFVPVEADVPDTDELDMAETFNMKGQEENGTISSDGPLPNVEEVRPTIYSLKYSGEMVHWKDSTDGLLSGRCLVDMSIMMGRHFSVGWGPRNQMTTLVTSTAAANLPSSVNINDLHTLLGGRKPNDMSRTVVQTLQLCGGAVEDPEVTFKESVEPHLKIVLEESVVSLDENGCPSIVPKLGVAGLNKHYSAAHALEKGTKDTAMLFSEQVWGLCHALWSDLPDCEVPDSHHCVMQRRQAVSEWLQSVVAETVKSEVSMLGPHDVATVFSFLTGANISEACARSQKLGDHQLSLLISQAGCGLNVRALLEKQLSEWRETEADRFISHDRIKSMMLTAGLPVHRASDGIINSCADLDWLRAFAIHLWYVCPLSSSVTDALLLYEKAFRGEGEHSEPYAASPLPSYSKTHIAESFSGVPIYDILYHLLRLFSYKSHPLEQLLNPATYSIDPLDYRLSWLLMTTLNSIGYSHLSDHASSLIHTSFADQLESHDLWEWAVFVLLHIPEPNGRAHTVQAIISRHITVDEDCEKESFLIEQLQIPVKWIYESKATRAISERRYKEAAKYLIQAENWNLGHTVIMEHIASRAIINENYEFLEEMLEALEREDHWKQVSGWQNGGCVILEYLGIIHEVEDIVKKQDPMVGSHLVRLKPVLTDLCSRIKLLPVRSPIDRLSQAEMAKRCSSLIQSLVMVASRWSDEASGDSLNEGVEMLSQLKGELPLPNDYAQQEWQSTIPYVISSNAAVSLT